MPVKLIEPVGGRVDVETGTLRGKSNRYEKRFSELAGIYRDTAAFDAVSCSRGSDVVYMVEFLQPSAAAGDMIFGVTRMLPGKVGREYFVTRGHIHARANRPEIYYGESGSALMLMESPEGQSRIVPILKRDVCYVPPYWIHRTVNVGAEDAVLTFAYPADAGQDYAIIGASNGMRQQIVDDGQGGWTATDNPDYRPRTPEEIARVYATADGSE